MAERIRGIIDAYNDTYHSGIKCTPREAMFGDESGIARQENGPDGKYQMRFKKRHREEFKTGQELQEEKILETIQRG